MVRFFMAIVAIGALAASVFASAASVNVTGGAIQAGMDATLTCDDAIAVQGWGLETDTGLVHNVRIGDIADACQGNALFVSVLDSGNNVIATGQVDPISATQHTVSFTPVNAANIVTLKVWIEGANP